MNELTIVDNQQPAGLMQTPRAVQAQLAEMHRLVDSVLVENVHYGVIPGTRSKSLLKPGAEIIFKAFLCSARHRSETIEIDRPTRFVMIRVYCEAVHIGTGAVLAEGMGAATSEKWLDTKVDFGWLYNSTLKIAEKRAEVDCALKLGAVSAHFTQDMEDYAGGNSNDASGGDTGAIPPAILLRCPLHNALWYDNKFGKSHKKDGGGYCNYKDVLKIHLEQACDATGTSAASVGAYVKKRYMGSWSKLNEREQAETLEAVLTGALVTPAMPVNETTGEVQDEETRPYFAPNPNETA